MLIGDRFKNIDELSTIPQKDLYDLIVHTEDVGLLREIAKSRFPKEAEMINDDDFEPFIRWPAINGEPRQHWLPLLLAKVAKKELLPDYLDKLIVFAAPSSATWYKTVIEKFGIFEQAIFPHVLKEHQLAEFGIDQRATFPLPVSSYVHNRHSQTGNREGKQIWYFTLPGAYKNSKVLVLDDALAEGITGTTVADALVNQLGANDVFYAAPLAKKMQGGLDLMQLSPFVSKMSILIHVTATHGPGGPIDFY